MVNMEELIMMSKFGEVSRKIRGEESLRTMAKKLEISPAFLSAMEVGRKAVSDHSEQDVCQKKSSGKKKQYKKSTDHVTYILIEEAKSHTRCHKGSHAKKSGRFSVRGHYRHYKSGKVIWIEEFVKENVENGDTEETVCTER